MTAPAYSESDVESRVGQARLEESLKHLERTMTEGFKRLEVTMLARDQRSDVLELRVTELEKRVDKVYWVWAAAVFIGTPVMVLLTKFLFGKLGL